MSWFRKKMWLDVEGGWAGWIDTPNSGADASPTGWGTEATLLNGGGYAANSWGTHKRYTFEWSDASSRQAAQFMQSLRNGAYGKGLIHFIEPTLYDTNVLPARIAQPSLSLDDGGIPLVLGAEAEDVAAPGWASNSLPVRAVKWNLNDIAGGFRGTRESFYLSIPEGYTLALGAVYTSTGGGGVFIRTGGIDVRLPKVDPATDSLVTPAAIMFSGRRYVRLWFGKGLTDTNATLTVTAITARLIRTRDVFKTGGVGYGDAPYGQLAYGGSELSARWNRMAKGPWVGGMGHSGVRFNGTPTLIHNTGVNGGQVGYAASFIETGAWN